MSATAPGGAKEADVGGIVEDLEQSAGAARPAVVALTEALDAHEEGAGAHAYRVALYTEAVARELGLEPELVARVRLAGLLHDVGKIGVSDTILRKPGPLDEEEWDEMRRHPAIGARILRLRELEDVRAWILSHHERLDGRGYPAGLRGTEISPQARILAVADAYVAMTSDRVYRGALSAHEALEELWRGVGTQFDRRVVAALEAVIRRERDPGRPLLRGLPGGSGSRWRPPGLGDPRARHVARRRPGW